MVTSITPVIQQYTPPAQVRVGDRRAYVTLEPDSYLDSTTSATQLVMQTHASPNVAITNGTDSYHRNQQYSVTAITTAAGAIAERYAYTAYGLPTIFNASATIIASSAISNRYTYTGREWDATLGLHHFRARWMSPSAGRFLGRDPIGYVDGSLLYMAYFPIASTDPDGEKLTNCSVHKHSLKSSDRMFGSLNKLKNLSDRLRNMLGEGAPSVYWDFQGGGYFKETLCTESCCNAPFSAPTREREIDARGTLLLGFSYPLGPGGSVRVTGQIDLHADFKLKSFQGGCEGLRQMELCGSMTGGGQLKACVGRKTVAEVCVGIKLQCDIVGACGSNGVGTTATPPHRGRCKFSFFGDACLANGFWCSELEMGNVDFDIPLIQ